MIETKEIEISGFKYTVTQMPARRALKVQAKLLKLIGPSFGQLYVSSGSDSPDEHFPKIISLLVDKIDENTFDTFILELIEHYVRIDGQEITKNNFDVIFAGRLNDLFLLLKFILEVNFYDFFSDAGILKDLLK
ncbi:MAG: hypothetical protein QXI16_00975 [Sulfolobaceae archaeon]